MSAFTQKLWSDDSIGGTPITAADLNRMEQGIADAATSVGLQTSSGTFNVISGQSFTIPLPAANAGTVIIYGTVGGAWDTVWMGAWATQSVGAKTTVAQIVTSTTGPGNMVQSVTAASNGSYLTVQTSLTGTTGVAAWQIQSVHG